VELERWPNEDEMVTELYGGAWSDLEAWERRCQPDGCIICTSGRPYGILAEFPDTWVTTDPEVAIFGYVCVGEVRLEANFHASQIRPTFTSTSGQAGNKRPARRLGDLRLGETTWSQTRLAASELTQLYGDVHQRSSERTTKSEAS